MVSAIAEKTAEEHEGLLNLINELLEALKRFPQDVGWGNSSWAQDHEFLDFIRVQEISLISARDNALKGFYREAYNIIRMVLEGYLLLWLISTCDKYRIHVNVKRDKGDRNLDVAKARYKQDIQQKLGTGLIDVCDEGKSTLVLVVQGKRIVDENGNDTGVIVPFYNEAWHQYRPTEHHLKRPSLQAKLPTRRFLQGEWAALTNRRAKAKPNERRHTDFYQKLFTFDSLLDNLRLNGVLNKKSSTRVLVHYNFLSGFTHSTKDAIKLSQPWHSFATANADIAYNHYKSELALLYVCHLLAMHLELELYYFQRWRPLPVKNVRKLYRPLCRRVNQDFGYFWFIFNSPHEFDKYEHANRKCNYKKRIFYRPEDIRPVDVRYYDDPLDRLRNLHQSVRELTTGNVFDSPFPREDAQHYL